MEQSRKKSWPVQALRGQVLPALAAVLIVAAMVGLATWSAAKNPGPTPAHKYTRLAQKLTARSNALVVYLDPATGRPAAPPKDVTRALERASQALTSRSDEGLATFTLPNGTKGVDLEGRFMNLSRVRRAPNGGLAVDGVNTPPAPER